MPATVLAADVRTGAGASVGPGEMITDDIYLFGNDIMIAGTVRGDVIAAGTTILVTGHVTGSVTAAGNTVTINGPVDGTVRAVGNVVTVAAPVGGDALMAGATLSTTPAGVIGRDILSAGRSLVLNGQVARNVQASAGTLTIGSSVGGAVTANVADAVLRDGADVRGGLQLVSDHDASIATGARVGGPMTRVAPPSAPPDPWQFAGVNILAWLRGFVGMATLGLLLVLTVPRLMQTVSTTIQTDALGSFATGLGLFVAVPIIASLIFAVGLMIGGWWIGPALLILLAVAAPVGYLVGAEWVGVTALTRFGSPPRLWAAMLIGVLILGVVSLVPVAGAFAVAVAALLGAGSIAMSGWRAYRRAWRTTPAQSAQPSPTLLQPAA